MNGRPVPDRRSEIGDSHRHVDQDSRFGVELEIQQQFNCIIREKKSDGFFPDRELVKERS